ncbi:MAG: hypothetical protein JWO68_207 [Actinomycetia bacterium]|nr:hypothetical protein [Actinomycetes bacterium]
MAALRPVVLDDRLLIEELLVGLPARRRRGPLHTTSYWYFRACRAAVLGGSGHLSGPLEGLGPGQREAAILSLLELREEIALPDPRAAVPAMARLAARHPRLNLLNLEAAAAAQLLSATVWLSEESAAGVLPSVLEAEGITWRTIGIG